VRVLGCLGLALLVLLGVIVVLQAAPLPSALDGRRQLMAAVITGLVGMALLGSLGGVIIVTLRGQASVLERTVADYGLDVRRTLGFRVWAEGLVGQRWVRVAWLPAAALQRGRVEVQVDATWVPEMAASLSPPLRGCGGCEPVGTIDGSLAAIKIYARDVAEAQRRLSDPRVVACLRDLADSMAGTSTWELHLALDGLRLYARCGPPSSASVAAWLRLCLDLARLA